MVTGGNLNFLPDQKFSKMKKIYSLLVSSAILAVSANAQLNIGTLTHLKIFNEKIYVAGSAGVACLKSPQEIRQHLADYLFEAARVGDNIIIREFASAHYDLNVSDEKGYTALILAAYHGHGSTVDLLIKNNADVKINLRGS